jgi:hypothetical protein
MPVCVPGCGEPLAGSTFGTSACFPGFCHHILGYPGKHPGLASYHGQQARYFGAAMQGQAEIDFHSLIDIFETNKKEKAYE